VAIKIWTPSSPSIDNFYTRNISIIYISKLHFKLLLHRAFGLASGRLASSFSFLLHCYFVLTLQQNKTRALSYPSPLSLRAYTLSFAAIKRKREENKKSEQREIFRSIDNHETRLDDRPAFFVGKHQQLPRLGNAFFVLETQRPSAMPDHHRSGCLWRFSEEENVPGVIFAVESRSRAVQHEDHRLRAIETSTG